jgi:hypothetical protein
VPTIRHSDAVKPRAWPLIWMNESGTYVKITPEGAKLFA